ncbi:hypothetical protein D3C86_2130680 [compost metagenome]
MATPDMCNACEKRLANAGTARYTASTGTACIGRCSRAAQARGAACSWSSQYRPVTYTSGSMPVSASNCAPSCG